MAISIENDILTQIGPGTPMGEVMRRYWLPALLSWELPEPDCPPVRVHLLGERLVAFRDTQGRLGLLDEFCAHRRVSLWFGRNEECGLRCVYHGWKYDVGGNCVDQMNEPRQFKEKVKITAYPVAEMGGIIWAYMGPTELRPPLPSFDWTRVPDTHRHVTKVLQECNWLQALEGGIDTSHAQILHRTFTATIGPTGIGPRGGAPRVEVDETDYGYRYAGVYPRGNEGDFVRTYHYIMPSTQIRPNSREGRSNASAGNPRIAGHIWVPMDDHSCMVYNWHYSIAGDPLDEEERAERALGNGPFHVDQTTFRSFTNASNSWNIDRQAQKTRSFTGIDGVNAQDRAVQESMGPVADRNQEALGPADMAIVTARKLLLEAVRTVQDGGSPPGTGGTGYGVRAMQDVIPHGADWRSHLLPVMYPNGDS